MPLYEYECESCGHRFELIQKFSDPPAQVCASCSGGPVRKLLSSPAIQFKGSGWYITDYARKGATPSGAGESKAETSSDKPAASTAKSDGSAPSSSGGSSAS